VAVPAAQEERSERRQPDFRPRRTRTDVAGQLLGVCWATDPASVDEITGEGLNLIVVDVRDSAASFHHSVV
jgi:hypothetical protein